MKTIGPQEFDKVISSRAVIQFSATWCGPCKALTRNIIANKGLFSVPFYKLDIDSSQSLAAKYGIRSVPTMILFENGEEVNRIVGVPPTEKIVWFCSATGI